MRLFLRATAPRQHTHKLLKPFPLLHGRRYSSKKEDSSERGDDYFRRREHAAKMRTISVFAVGTLAAVASAWYLVDEIRKNAVAIASRTSESIPGKDIARDTLDKEKNKQLPPELVKHLTKLLGDRFVLKDADREAHGKDFSYHIAPPPDAVAYPNTEAEIVAMVQLCVAYRVPVIPYSAGTSLEGHTIAPDGGITIDVRNMNKVLRVHEDDLDCVVQPGVLYNDLNDFLRDKNLFFPVDPGPGAAIGGMVATSCSGTHAVRYGTMKDNVLSLRVVLPDGSVVKTRSRAKKSAAGYDLTHLFIGSEGTLGIVTEITVKLKRIPETSAVALATFPKIADATKTVMKTMAQGITIGRVELLDNVTMKAVNLSSGTEYDELDTLLFEFAGTPSEVELQGSVVEKIAKANGCSKFKFAREVEEREALWLARKVALYSSKALRPSAEIWITDVCVPLSRLADIITATKQDLAISPLQAPLVSHAGDGNFHLFILFDPNDAAELQEAHRINDNLIKRAIEFDGTCTGEHGVGLGKRDYLESELGKEAVALMRTIKTSLDPHNLFNPGKIVDVRLE